MSTTVRLPTNPAAAQFTSRPQPPRHRPTPAHYPRGNRSSSTPILFYFRGEPPTTKADELGRANGIPLNQKKNTRYIKKKIDDLLAPDMRIAYWEAFRSFLIGHTDKEQWLDEISEIGETCLELIPLHNMLVRSIIHNARFKKEFKLSFGAQISSSKSDRTSLPMKSAVHGNAGTYPSPMTPVSHFPYGAASALSAVKIPHSFGSRGFANTVKHYGTASSYLSDYPHLDLVHFKMQDIAKNEHKIGISEACSYMMIRAVEIFLKNIIHACIRTKNSPQGDLPPPARRKFINIIQDYGRYLAPSFAQGTAHSYLHYRDEAENEHDQLLFKRRQKRKSHKKKEATKRIRLSDGQSLEIQPIVDETIEETQEEPSTNSSLSLLTPRDLFKAIKLNKHILNGLGDELQPGLISAALKYKINYTDWDMHEA